MKILVIEDQPFNIESAKQTLQGHDLTIVDCGKDAMRILAGKWDGKTGGRVRPDFDCVLTDLFVPFGEASDSDCTISSFTGKAKKEGKSFDVALEEYNSLKTKEMPSGVVFALRAVLLGIPVAILTDANHHQDAFVTCMDCLGYEPTKQFARFDTDSGYSLGRHESGRGIKDWGKALQKLIE